MIDFDVVVVELELDGVVGIPVQAQCPDILLAAGDAAIGGGGERQKVEIDIAVARGQFPGAPDKTTPFPAEMLVDYVRVYQKASYGDAKARGEGKLPF